MNAYTHLWIADVLALVGVVALLFGSSFTSMRAAFARIRVDEATRGRLLKAVDARESAEQSLVPYTRLVGLIALLCAALEFAPVPPLLPYAFFVLALSVTALIVSSYALRALPKRVALLQARDAASVVPRYIFAVVSVQSLCALALVGEPAYRLSAVAVCVAGIVSTFVGWRLTYAPARLLGDDLPVEQFVDQRIRLNRASMAVTMSGAPVMVLLGISQDNSPTLTVIAAFGLVWVMFVIQMVWVFRAVNAPPKPDDLAAIHGS
ncbi:MAG TPA: hypothetical protein VIJ12_00040 [Candidatus Baltobacteraceae bacterium]